MFFLRFSLVVGTVLGLGQGTPLLAAAGPVLLPHQGRLAVGDTYFEGDGAFKFALLNAEATTFYWLNAPDSNLDHEPDTAVTLPVQRGLYSVLLGDARLANMAPLEASVFAQPELYLRVWFDDGVHGFERLEPDQRVVPPPYALVAGEVPDGTITPAKLSPAALQPLQVQLAALLTELVTLSNRLASLEGAVRSGLPPGVPVLSSLAADPALLAEGLAPVLHQPAPGWQAGATANEPSPRFGHSAVWTGSELWVWGGTLSDFVLTTAAGGRYQPDADQWTPLPAAGAPSPRTGHGTVWTGQEMIVWGGFGEGQYRNTGARLAPGAAAWTALSTTGTPTGRDGHVMVWTGKYVLVWGGRNFTGLRQDGALFDPVLDQWTALTLANPPAARRGAAAVWTGESLLLWGGEGAEGTLNSGARLRFDAAGEPLAWEALPLTGAPAPRAGHTAVWTGQFLIIWGGTSDAGLLNDGARFAPAANAWQPLATAGAPAARQLHNAVWTGREMLILGGVGADGASPAPHAYAPADDTWRALSQAGNPPGRSQATAVWTGAEVLHFGGRFGSTVRAALYRLDPRPTWYFYLKP